MHLIADAPLSQCPTASGHGQHLLVRYLVWCKRRLCDVQLLCIQSVRLIGLPLHCWCWVDRMCDYHAPSHTRITANSLTNSGLLHRRHSQPSFLVWRADLDTSDHSEA